MNTNRQSKAQSAMEYLMTYGWAILIIAVVLAALFSLNVFNAGAQLGTSCIGQPGFSCSQPSISTTGNLVFTFGQGSGFTAYNAAFACISSANAIAVNSAIFNTITSTYGIQAAGTSTGGNGYPSNYIASGTSLQLIGLQCYPGTGGVGSGTSAFLYPIGSSFVGELWMSYSQTTGGPARYVLVGQISVKSSS